MFLPFFGRRIYAGFRLPIGCHIMPLFYFYWIEIFQERSKSWNWFHWGNIRPPKCPLHFIDGILLCPAKRWTEILYKSISIFATLNMVKCQFVLPFLSHVLTSSSKIDKVMLCSTIAKNASTTWSSKESYPGGLRKERDPMQTGKVNSLKNARDSDNPGCLIL